MAVTVQLQRRCELSFVTAADGASVCASECTRKVSVACVLSQNQYIGAAQQQQYNCRSRVSSSTLLHSSHGVCVWLVHSRRSSNDNNRFASDATTKHTSSDLIPGTRNYTSSSSSSSSSKSSAYFLVTIPNICYAR